jgi:flagellar assembly factor FliW
MKKKVIDSQVFGKIEYSEEELIVFEKPILGFDKDIKYLHVQQEDSVPFSWLQSVISPELAFMIIDPFLIFNDYSFKISDEDQKAIELEKPEDALVFVIVSIPADNPKGITANLLAPIVINIKNNKAAQIILKSEKYSTKMPLLGGGSQC